MVKRKEKTNKQYQYIVSHYCLTFFIFKSWFKPYFLAICVNNIYLIYLICWGYYFGACALNYFNNVHLCILPIE
jgi:hypothetical protein